MYCATMSMDNLQSFWAHVSAARAAGFSYAALSQKSGRTSLFGTKAQLEDWKFGGVTFDTTYVWI